MKNSRPSKKAVLVFLILCASFTAFFYLKWVYRIRTLYPENLGKGGACPGKTELLELNDTYLIGVLEPNKPIRVIWNWYACHAPQVGDVALLQISKNLPPRAKIIRAVTGDRLNLTHNQDQGRWNLEVNGKVVLDYRGEPYAFGGPSLPPIGRYIKMVGPALGPGDVIALSTKSPGEMDSGLFGVSSVSDLVAKVILGK